MAWPYNFLYITSLDMKINFGEHRGKTIGWIIDNDLPYCQWLTTLSNIKFDSSVLQIIKTRYFYAR